MKTPVPIATSQVNTRCLACDQLAARKIHRQMRRTPTIRKNEDIAVIIIWIKSGVERAPIVAATTAAAINARFVSGLMVGRSYYRSGQAETVNSFLGPLQQKPLTVDVINTIDRHTPSLINHGIEDLVIRYPSLIR